MYLLITVLFNHQSHNFTVFPIDSLKVFFFKTHEIYIKLNMSSKDFRISVNSLRKSNDSNSNLSKNRIYEKFCNINDFIYIEKIFEIQIRITTEL